MDNISLEIRKDGNYKEVLTERSNKKLPLKYPTEDAFPPLILPRYEPSAYSKVLRIMTEYSMEFYPSEETDCIYLKNQGEGINLMGSIIVSEKSQREPNISLDFDWGETEDLQSRASLIYHGKCYPLTWKDPRYNLQVNSSLGKASPLVFKLEGNFGDMKVFSINKNIMPILTSQDILPLIHKKE